MVAARLAALPVALLVAFAAAQQHATPTCPTSQLDADADGVCDELDDCVDSDQDSECERCYKNPAHPSHDVGGLLPYMRVYPPVGRPEDEPINVYMNVAVVRVDAIEPTKGHWDVRLQTDMYWDTEACHSTGRNVRVCSTRYNNLLYFGRLS